MRRWDHELNERKVHVRAAVQEVRGKLVTSTPKTAAGHRVVVVPATIVADLRWHLRCFAEPGPDGRVFVGPKGATPLRSNFHKHWRRATVKASVSGVHLHDLRHVGATLAATTGASLRELMARLGHTSARAALIYQHASSDRDRAIADAPDVLAEDQKKRKKRDDGGDDPPLVGAPTGT